jgi:hypothetical protein
MRMNLRRFTRLTNTHRKSARHFAAAQSLLIAWYNWCRKHSTIKQTPAMAAGLADKAWTIRELLERAAEGLRCHYFSPVNELYFSCAPIQYQTFLPSSATSKIARYLALMLIEMLPGICWPR